MRGADDAGAGIRTPCAQLDSRPIPFVANDESIRLAGRCAGMSVSSVIGGAWYLPHRQELDLLFTSGRRYRYSHVPSGVARGFVEAASKGGFYNREIRNRFPCRELGGEAHRRICA